MQAGHTFTIEPMICEGTPKHVLWPVRAASLSRHVPMAAERAGTDDVSLCVWQDKWTAATADGRRAAQFEHTLLITETGVEALTGRLPTSPPFTFE